MNGHIVRMIHSKRKIAEQLSFSIDVCQTMGIFCDKLQESENDRTLTFLAPMSSFTLSRRNMSQILPHTYSIGSFKSVSLTDEELCAYTNLTNYSTRKVTTFRRLYRHSTILYTNHYKGKRESSICLFAVNGTKVYGCIEKFILTPPTVLVKPFSATLSSLLKDAGNPSRTKLKNYAQADLLSAFIVQVKNEMLPVCAVPITAILGKCVRISCKDSTSTYIVRIPNNFEHH